MEEVMNVEIIDEDVNGNGIAKVDGVVIFVKYALLGEVVRVRITKKNKHFYEAEILEIIKESSRRIVPVCKYYKECGGCSLGHINIDDEVLRKQKYIEKKFSDVKVNKLINANDYFYRNKVIFHVKDGKLGYYKEESNDIVDIDYCYLADKDINKVLKQVRDFDLSGVSEVLIRSSFNTDDVMLVFYGDIDKEIVSSVDGVTSLYLNDELIKGNPYITEVVGDLKFTIYKDAFFQVNTYAMKELYDVVRKYAGCGNRLLDLYCGTGTIGMYLHENFKEIVGVELNSESIKNANINKKLNGISNIEFINGDASLIKDSFDVVVVDPPRAGLSKKVIGNLLNINSKRIIYVSCNPNTLARDLKLLGDKYEVLEITPVNIFSRTKHVECCALLSKTIEKQGKSSN